MFSFFHFFLPVLISLSPCPAPYTYPSPSPWAFSVMQFPSHWWYSSLPKCQMFLDRNKLHFFMAYGKLPWLLLPLYPLCELNMYSVACCLRCYCRVTYGTDSIRMKLALDNPSDYMHPDRLLLGLPSVLSLSSVWRPQIFIIGYHLCHIGCGMGVGEGGACGSLGKKADQTDRLLWKGWWGGIERPLCLHLELTFTIIFFGSGCQAYSEKGLERSL